MSSVQKSREIENPKVGDSVVSECGIIKVTFEKDGTIPITKLTQQRGSFYIQLFYAGKAEPDTTIAFKTDDPVVHPYRVASGKTLAKLEIITNPGLTD